MRKDNLLKIKNNQKIKRDLDELDSNRPRFKPESNPQQANETIRLSNKTGLAPKLVERNTQRLQDEERKQETNEKKMRNPL